MKIVVLGAGIIGIATAWYLLDEGHEVVVIDRQPDAALETSFANGAQISVSFCEPWANAGAPFKVAKWLLRDDSPLLFRPRLDPNQWRWGLAFLMQCTNAAFERNVEELVQLGRYSHASLKELVARTGIEYCRLERGILHFFSSQADYDTILENAQAAFKVWRNVPAPRRGEAIRLCADALRAHKDALGSLVALEMGKSKPEGDGEVQEMIDIGEFAVGLSRQLYGLTMHSERPGHRMYEQWHPIGLVGVISAFNFPVAVWAWNSFIAAVCGDISIWKPSPKTPLSAIASMKICNEALRKGGFPDIFFLFNDAGSDLAQGFVDDRRVALVSFTGSTKVGRMVGERVARRMGRSLLELGGNNAIIVDETADLKLAIPAIVFGAVGTAGQRCTTTRRLIVHESVYDDVLAKLVTAYKQVEKKIGDPTDPANLMGPLNSKDGVDAYLDAIATEAA